YANLLEDSGRIEDAKKVYEEIAAKFQDGDQIAEAAWRLAYIAIKSDSKDAEQYLGAILAAKEVSAVERARARYWLARTLEKTSPDKARAMFEETALHPTFYAWLTVSHLRESK